MGHLEGHKWDLLRAKCTFAARGSRIQGSEGLIKVINTNPKQQTRYGNQ